YRDEGETPSDSIKALIQKFSPNLSLKEEIVKEVLKSAVQGTQEGFAAARIPFDNLRLTKSIENALNGARTDDETPLAEPPPPPTGVMEFASLTREVELVLMSGEVFDLQDIILMILEAILRGGHFDRVLYCVTNDDYVVARMGLGEE